MQHRLIRELDSWRALMRQQGDLSHAVVQGLDLSREEFKWDELNLEGTVFLGCTFPASGGLGGATQGGKGQAMG